MKDRELVDNLRKFWLLQLIVDCGNFREAAARAKVTQSALSQTVTQLESLSGRILLCRERGSVKATPACDELLRRVAPVLSAIAQISREPEEAPAIAWMSLGAYQSFGAEFVPELITRLQLKCPGIRLTLRVGRSGGLATLVRKGDLCMAVIRELDEMGRLDLTPITTDRLGFWASANHPIFSQDWDGLRDAEIGTLSPDSDGHPRYHTRLMEAAGIKRNAMFVSDSFEALRAAAAQGALVAVLPESLATSSGSMLQEILPPDAKAAAEAGKALGVHRICLISRQGCDPRENDFLSTELRDIVAERHRTKTATRPLACAANRFSSPGLSPA